MTAPATQGRKHPIIIDSFVRGVASDWRRTLVGKGHKNSGLESCTPSCCTSFQTTEAQYRSSLSETSSRNISGIPKTLSTRSLAPVSERSTIRQEIVFPNRGTILAGLPSAYRTVRRCSTILRPSTLRLQRGRNAEVVVDGLMRGGILRAAALLSSIGGTGGYERARAAQGRYRAISSSASHSSTGGEAPSRSTTTCRKSTSSNAPGFGIDVTSPTARTVPRSFTVPTVIVTGAPSCTGLVSSLRSATGSLSYRPGNGAIEHSFEIAATFPGAVIHTLSLPPAAGLAEGERA